MKLLTTLFMIFSFSVFAQGPAPVDAKFLDQFSEHHKDAIEMAKMAEEKAEDKELKKMAQKMVKDQSKEIDQMKSWRQRYYPQATKTEMTMAKMDMSKLEKSKGHEFDMAFSEMMAMHHQQGIEMVNGVSNELTNPEIKKFAQNAAKKQREEKEKLEKMTHH